MVLRSGRVFFRHDLIADFFCTVSILNRCPDVDATACTLARPINAALTEFAVGACETFSELSVLLRSASAELLIACIEGRCGSKARSFVLDRVRDMLDVAVSDYRRLVLGVDTDPQGRHSVSASLPSELAARPYENYMAVVPYVLGHGLLPDVLRAFGAVDRYIWDAAERLRGEHPDIKIAFRRRAYNAVYGTPASVRAMHEIQQGFNLFRTVRDSDALTAALWEKLSKPQGLYPGQLLILLGTLNRLEVVPELVPEDFAKVVQELWNLGIQRMRLEVVELVRRSGPHLNAEQEEDVRTVLESWLSDNDPFTNSLVFDALQGVGGPVTGLSVESAHEEFLDALAMEPTPLASERAMHLYTCTFDHPCDAFYCEAFYERLTDAERQALLLRAADATYADLSMSMVIAELARNPVAAAIPCLRKFSRTPDFSSPWMQSAVETYVRSLRALARMGAELEAEGGEEPVTSAWHCAARLLHFLASRPAGADGARQAVLWAQLESCGAARAFDVVMRVESCDLLDDRDAGLSFLPACGEGLRRLARAALAGGYQPETEVPKLAQWRDLATEHRTFALQVLGRVGRTTDLELVRAWTEDASVGRHAIAAARLLESPVRDTDGRDTH
ncbi:hypothetical protein [Paraburkholderia sp. JPY419]|uniref:hypothetical protein n=1 Tax=Paraburkholderia sp. JPY419 TaxID=667660 RepID=UPI003D1BD9F9